MIHPSPRQCGRRVITALLGAGLLASLAGCGAQDDTYGAVPDYLPKTSVVADGVLNGSPAKPAFTSEGDAVRVSLAGGRALVTVTGPEVPGEGLPYVTPSTTCTWTVTVVGERGSVPIALADFSTLDHLGGASSLSILDVAPQSVRAGETVSFHLRSVMVVGEGVMHWAPTGAAPVATWDFEVEND